MIRVPCAGLAEMPTLIGPGVFVQVISVEMLMVNGVFSCVVTGVFVNTNWDKPLTGPNIRKAAQNNGLGYWRRAEVLRPTSGTSLCPDRRARRLSTVHGAGMGLVLMAIKFVRLA